MSWFDDNDPERPQRAPATATASTQPPPTGAPGPWAGGYVPYYPADPKTGKPNPDMPIAPTAGNPNPSQGSAQAAVVAAFAKKGITPNPGEVDYWVGKINDTGGWDKPDNQKFWTDRMAQDAGGVGDRSGKPEAGSGADALGSLIAPFTEQFTNPAYVAPTGVNDSNDPGFSARMNAADDALQRSAAAKGSLLSGSTLKALSDWNSDYASNEYAAVDSRARQTYATNSNNAYQQYAQRRANFYQNQDSPFAKLFGMAQLDSSNNNAFNANQLGYAQLGASTLQNPSYANYLTQGANATAAGQVGAGNAYSGLFGNLGNTATLGYLATRPPTNPAPYYHFAGGG